MMKIAKHLNIMTTKPLVTGIGFLFALLLFMGLVYDMQADSGELAPPPIMPDAPVAQTGNQNQPDLVTALEPRLYLPLVTKPAEETAWVDTNNRQAVVNFYQIDYKASDGIDSGWTGDRDSCNPGTTSAAFKDAIVNRINYFRKMAGVPPIVGLRDDYNQKAQQAALMMSVNEDLSHDPPNNWKCYTADGDEAAGSSNLYLGRFGPAAISGYITDPGGGNYFVGHRRWILYPQTQHMGTGDIPSGAGWSSNSLWVFDNDNMWGARPDTRETFVAWPPPGYVPYQVVYPRWSFSYAKADFSSATVTMTQNGSPVTVDIQLIGNGFGENTLVWEPDISLSAPTSDVVFHVTISQVGGTGVPSTFDYDVIMINPG